MPSSWITFIDFVEGLDEFWNSLDEKLKLISVRTILRVSKEIIWRILFNGEMICKFGNWDDLIKYLHLKETMKERVFEDDNRFTEKRKT